MSFNFDVTNPANYGKAVNAYRKDPVNKPHESKTEKTPGKDYGEGTLSVKAQELLKKLRDKYGDYDIFVGDSEEALNDLSRGSKKTVSVMFSADELEKMAEDEEYANTRMAEMEKAAGDVLKFMEDYNNSEESKESGTMVKSVAVTINPDGTTSVFAELAKVNEAQRERIEKSMADKKEKAQEDKKADGLRKKEKPEPITLTRVSADSLEELKKIVSGFDWSPFMQEQAVPKGQHFDFSV
ncbi:MAG: DUF6033 family protein [Lachnospiraceae bacterium]|nr:DUF6033 family protein [Lachnospiraceae bacterium]